MIYDGDCGFCKECVQYWNTKVGDCVDFQPSQAVKADFPAIPQEQFDQSVVLIMPDGPEGQFYIGAEAVFRALATSKKGLRSDMWLWSYQKIPGFALLSEFFYRQVANYRPFFSRLTRFLFKERL